MISYIFFWFLIVAAAWCAWKICVADFRRRIIPDAYSFPLMLMGLLVVVFFPWVCTISDAAVGAAFGYGLAAIAGFIFDYFLKRKNPDADSPIGMGDIKLMGAAGLWLGTWGLAAALILACIGGYTWGLIQKQKYIPFAPFLISGGILALIGMAFLL